MNALDHALVKRLKSFVGLKLDGIITSNFMNEDPYICFIEPGGELRSFILEFEHSECSLQCSLHEDEVGSNYYKIQTEDKFEIGGNVLLRIKVKKKIEKIGIYLNGIEKKDFNNIGAFIFSFSDRTKMLFKFGTFLPQLSITTNSNEIEIEQRVLAREKFVLKSI